VVFCFFSKIILVMGRIFYTGIVDKIEGSVNGSTFQANNAGNIIRSKPSPAYKCTAKQALRRGLFFNRVFSWNALSLGQQQLWNAFAALHTHSDFYGKSKTITGENWYISINSNLQIISEPFVSVPPAYVLPAAVPAYSVIMNANNIYLNFSSPNDLTDHSLIIFTTPPVTASSPKLRNKLVLTSIINSGSVSSLSLKSDWQAAHGISYPSSSQKFRFKIAFMLFHIHKSSGISSPGSFYIQQLSSYLSGIGNMIIQNNFVVS